MKLSKYIYLLIVLLSANNINSQNLDELKDYNWDKEPNYFVHNNDDDEIIGVKDKMLVNFEYDDDGNLIEYLLIHNAFILNSDEKIEEYNKLYLPTTSATSELKVIKARVIKKNGDIIVLDDSKILTSKNEETKIESKYYAFEGIEIGGIIEYYYILKRLPVYSGRKIGYQFDFVNLNCEFDLYSPSNLLFKFKSYNKLPEIALDTNASDYNHWQLAMDKVDRLEYEQQCAYGASKKFFVYKLDGNKATNKTNIYKYSDIANNIYNLFYAEKSKADLKGVKKVIKESDCKIARNSFAKIRALEDHIKSNYYIVGAGGNDLSKISKIVENKTVSYRGIITLYAAIFNELDIKHQIVLTTNRFDLKFDKKFEASNFLTDYLIYFPDEKSYMSPTSLYSRLGFPLPEFTNNYGLFIKEISVNNMKTGIAKIKFIEPVDYRKNYDQMLLDIQLDADDISKSLVKFERATAGYYAINIQPFMNLFKDEDKKEVVDEYIKYLSKDISIINKTVLYDDAKYFGVEPFTVNSEFYLDPFIEKAGNTVIIKVGNLIGPQMEMYQEKERILPLESDFKRNYHRVITFNVPEKYKIKNITDLNIHNNFVKDDKELMSFKSSYTFEKNVLTITVDEYYDMIEVEPELYNTYRKVINSAADFNKVSLILE